MNNMEEETILADGETILAEGKTRRLANEEKSCVLNYMLWVREFDNTAPFPIQYVTQPVLSSD